jgi:hypothetical protein
MTSSGSSSGSGSGSDRSLSPRRFFFFLLAFLLFSALRFFPEKTFFTNHYLFVPSTLQTNVTSEFVFLNCKTMWKTHANLI